MKKYFLILLFIGLIAAVSCKKEAGPVMGDITPSVLSSTASGDIVLLESDSLETVSDFTWTKSTTDLSIAMTYTLEMDTAGNDFADAYTLATGENLSYGIDEMTMNGILLANGYAPEEPVSLEFRVSTNVQGVEPVYSNVLSFSITPYEAVIDYPFIYVPGQYQGWNNSDSITVLYSVKSDDKYEGYLYFSDAFDQGFKFTDAPNWDDAHVFGDQDAGGNSGLLANPGNNILSAAAAAGYYKINADLSGMTYSVLKTDWSIYGAATANSDISMTNNTTDPKTILSVTTDLVAGDFVFRANNSDALFYGDDSANFKLNENAGSINIAADGNYTITLDLTQAVYTYTITQN